MTPKKFLEENPKPWRGRDFIVNANKWGIYVPHLLRYIAILESIIEEEYSSLESALDMYCGAGIEED